MVMRASARGGRADGRADAVPEPDVVATVRAIEAELVRVLELSRVTVRGAVHQEDDCAGREIDTADRHRHACQSELALDGGLEPQGFLDEGRDLVGAVAERLLEIGTVAEDLERCGEEPGSCLAAR